MILTSMTNSKCCAFCSQGGLLWVSNRRGSGRLPVVTAVRRGRGSYGSGGGAATKKSPVKGFEGARGISKPNEEHKIFDEAFIVVRAGNGGVGEIVEQGKGRIVKNHKYQAGRRLPKKMWLEASPPAAGCSGGDVVVHCSPSLSSLTHLHDRKVYNAKNGRNGNPEDGSQAPKRMKFTPKKGPSLKISVPPGTVVKRKSGRFIGEVLNPGDEVVVAQGGQGGVGVVQPSTRSKGYKKVKAAKMRNAGIDVIEMEDENWKAESFGSPGEEVSLHLLLRIVADVGFVGLPNAGKSSLLASLTRARPQIAAYPFTTLIPNLGVMGEGGDPVLVDLPGLIEGAHVGRGLGRKFLQHLRRTRALLHVVDAATPDPVADFISIREELRMYNPDYCCRPFVVALNKIDLEEPKSKKDELVQGIQAAADGLQENLENSVVPDAILPVSAVEDLGIDDLRLCIDEMIRKTDKDYKSFSEIMSASDEELLSIAGAREAEPWE